MGKNNGHLNTTVQKRSSNEINDQLQDTDSSVNGKAKVAKRNRVDSRPMIWIWIWIVVANLQQDITAT